MALVFNSGGSSMIYTNYRKKNNKEAFVYEHLYMKGHFLH